MAKTMIEKIRETEAQAQAVISAAHEEVKSKIKEATQRAEADFNKAMAQADRDSAEIIDKAKAQAQADKTAAKRRGWAEGEKLSAKADKNRDRAVDAAVEIIFS